jgi:chemotaxis protein methyltransferase CheR
VSGESGPLGSCSPNDLSDEEFGLFRNLIKRETGITLNDQKRALVVARLGRHVRRLGLGSYRAYHQLLSAAAVSDAERAAFVSAVTTNTTSFFREAYHFEFLRRELSAKGRLRRRRSPLRIWSSACSTGEEPYSLAITLARAAASPAAIDARILATDIDAAALACAGDAVYERELLVDLSAEDINRFFVPEGAGGRFRVAPRLRQLVTFNRVNLLAEPWPMQGGFDAIFCRNVVIYFDLPSRRRLFHRLESALVPGGFLFLGHSESLQGAGTSLRACGQTIYRKDGLGGAA